MPNPESPFPPHIQGQVHDEIVVDEARYINIDSESTRRLTERWGAFQRQYQGIWEVSNHDRTVNAALGRGEARLVADHTVTADLGRDWIPLDPLPLTNRSGEQKMYDILVTTNSTADQEFIGYSSEGQLGVVDCPGHDWHGHVVLNIGKQRVVDLTKPGGTSFAVNDLSFDIRPLRTGEAVTLIAR